MSETGTDIIVKGGSVKLMFDSTLYKKDDKDPKTHKHKDRKITRVMVQDETNLVLFDREVNEDGWTITVSTKG